jgi:hypothetical protein
MDTKGKAALAVLLERMKRTPPHGSWGPLVLERCGYVRGFLASILPTPEGDAMFNELMDVCLKKADILGVMADGIFGSRPPLWRDREVEWIALCEFLVTGRGIEGIPEIYHHWPKQVRRDYLVEALEMAYKES